LFTAPITYRKLFHLLSINCFKTCKLLMKCVFTPPSKVIVSVLDGDLVFLMIPTMRRTTWATLQGLRTTGFPVTRGRSLAPTPDSGSTADFHDASHPSTVSLLLDTVVGWRSGARRLARPSAERICRTTGPDDRLCHRRAAFGRAVLGGSSVGARVREGRSAR